jgi:hypothetical protein
VPVHQGAVGQAQVGGQQPAHDIVTVGDGGGIGELEAQRQRPAGGVLISERARGRPDVGQVPGGVVGEAVGPGGGRLLKFQPEKESNYSLDSMLAGKWAN